MPRFGQMDTSRLEFIRDLLTGVSQNYVQNQMLAFRLGREQQEKKAISQRVTKLVDAIKSGTKKMTQEDKNRAVDEAVADLVSLGTPTAFQAATTVRGLLERQRPVSKTAEQRYLDNEMTYDEYVKVKTAGRAPVKTENDKVIDKDWDTKGNKVFIWQTPEGEIYRTTETGLQRQAAKTGTTDKTIQNLLRKKESLYKQIKGNAKYKGIDLDQILSTREIPEEPQFGEYRITEGPRKGQMERVQSGTKPIKLLSDYMKSIADSEAAFETADIPYEAAEELASKKIAVRPPKVIIPAPKAKKTKRGIDFEIQEGW